MFDAAMVDNIRQMAEFVRLESRAVGHPDVLDLGCWDGVTTASYVPSSARLTGVEACAEAADKAKANGLKTVVADLNGPLPLDDGIFDIVTSNQVIEHLYDTDTFMAEAFRVLKPGGVAVISTENLSSWHNIAALCLGWQAFSLTNVSSSQGLGNPLATMRGGEMEDKGWQHQRIFSYRGLIELAQVHGFEQARIMGSGYYPLPGRIARVDRRHSAFITLVARKRVL
jgi:SAM-dependent methyltransferase